MHVDLNAGVTHHQLYKYLQSMLLHGFSSEASVNNIARHNLGVQREVDQLKNLSSELPIS